MKMFAVGVVFVVLGIVCEMCSSQINASFWTTIGFALLLGFVYRVAVVSREQANFDAIEAAHRAAEQRFTEGEERARSTQRASRASVISTLTSEM